MPLAKLTLFLAIVLLATPALAARPDGELELNVVEATTGQPLAARIHLRNSRGRPLRARDLGVAHHGDHFYIDGATLLELRRGQYTFDLDAGWERRTQSGDFEIQRHAQDAKTIKINAFADLAKEDWRGADLDANRQLHDLGVVLRAEQLAYTPLTAWRGAEQGSWQSVARKPAGKIDFPPGVTWQAARYESADSALMFFGSSESLERETLPELKSLSVAQLRRFRQAGLRVVAADLTSWELPIWLAADALDAVSVIDRTSQFDGVASKASTGRPADRLRYPGPQGPGRWREAIYFHVLNAGLRMPAVAGSGSGETESPLGTNRVYAYCPDSPPDEFDRAAWWQAVEAGQTVVTNGPLLRPTVYGEPPGYVFRLDAAGRFDAAIGLNLSTRQPVDYLDLIRDGQVVESVRLADWAQAGGKLPVLEFAASGWFAIRVATAASDRYQFALTSPYYVQGPDGPRISAASCQFFLDWINEYEQQAPAVEQEAIKAAREFWRARITNATAP